MMTNVQRVDEEAKLTQIVVCLYPNANDQGAHLTIEELKTCGVDSVQIFSDPDTCVDYITSADEQQTLLFVLVGSSAQVIVSAVHDFTVVNSLFIYNTSESDWSRNYEKIVCITNNKQELLEKLSEQTVYM